MGRDRQKQKNEEVRRSILDAAMQIGIQEGFEHLSIRKITTILGYSVGSIYYYFKDRQEIMDTIHEEASQLIAERIKAVMDMEKGFEYNNRAVFSTIMDLAIDQPEKYNLIVMDKYGKRKETISPWLSLMEQLLQRGIEKGELKEMDVTLTTFNIWSSFIGLMIMVSANQENSKEQALCLLDNHMKLLMDGIRHE